MINRTSSPLTPTKIPYQVFRHRQTTPYLPGPASLRLFFCCVLTDFIQIAPLIHQ